MTASGRWSGLSDDGALSHSWRRFDAGGQEARATLLFCSAATGGGICHCHRQAQSVAASVCMF